MISIRPLRVVCRALAFVVPCLAISYTAAGCGGGSGDDDASSGSCSSDAGGDSAVIVGDASSDAGTDAGPSEDGSVDSGPAPFVPLLGRSTSIPGSSEGYFCTAISVTTPLDITAFHAEATGNIIEATVTTGLNATPGDSACTSGSIGGQLLYAFSAGTSELAFPSGSAMHVPAGSLILNLHVDNVSDSTAADTAAVSIRTMASTPIDLVQAFYIGTRSINIPSDGVTHTATGGCVYFPTTLDVFAVTPMMYTTGTHSSLTAQQGATTTTVFDGPFDFANQVTHALTPEITIHGGDKVLNVCSYVNTTGSTRAFNDYAGNGEHCYAATYAHGIGTLGLGMFQCAQ